MGDQKTLVLSRNSQALWVYQGNITDSLYYGVTGVERLQSYTDRYPVAVLENGKTLGLVWDVEEIKEVW